MASFFNLRSAGIGLIGSGTILFYCYLILLSALTTLNLNCGGQGIINQAKSFTLKACFYPPLKNWNKNYLDSARKAQQDLRSATPWFIQSTKRSFTSSSYINNIPSDVNSKFISDFSLPMKFESLDKGYNIIKFKLLGVSGVYMLVNSQDDQRFYIGSSVNLARRSMEYLHLTNGIRNPQSFSEEEISKTPASKWVFIILAITTPQLSLIKEQYEIIIKKPTINRYLSVIPRINSQWRDLDDAINQIKFYLSLFDKDSFGYIRFNKFLKSYEIAKNLKYDSEDISHKYFSIIVFVYDKDFLYKEPIVYSSINKALKSLNISYGLLLDCINNKYLFKNNLILSFEPLLFDNFKDYLQKPEGDNLLRKQITLFNEDNEPVFDFKSQREMARYFQVDAKIIRSSIVNGAYQNFSVSTKDESYRKIVYVYDSETLNLIYEFKNFTATMKYAKLSFYTLKNLIETKTSHNGVFYSYSKLPPVL